MMSPYSQLSSNQSDNDMRNTEDEFDKSVQEYLQLKKSMNQFYNYSNPLYMPVIQAPMNIRSETRFIGLSGGIILGYKGRVCKKCLIWNIAEIPNEETRIFSRSYHTCDPQRLQEAQFVTDIPGTINKRRQELISLLVYVVNSIAKQQGLVDLTAVEVPASIFDAHLNSYEEYVDLNSLQSVTLDWAYRAAKRGQDHD